MWATFRQMYRRLVSPPQPPCVSLGGPSPVSERSVIEIGLGDAGVGGVACDARLSDALAPERLRRVVRFCERRRLPVGWWVVTGAWHLPGRVDEAARWLVLLCRDAGAASVHVDTAGMPARFERRLRAHLTRLGCEVS